MRPESLAARLLAWTLPVALAITIAISLSTYLIARTALLHELENGVVSFTQVAASQAKAFFQQRRNDLATIGQSPQFRDHFMNLEYGLTAEAGVYRQGIERLLLDFSRRTGVYPQLTYLDVAGRDVCRIRGGRIIQSKGRSIDPEFWKGLRRLSQGQFYSSMLHEVPWHSQKVVTYGTGIFDDAGMRLGSLVFDYDLGHIHEALSRLRLGESGRSYLRERDENTAEMDSPRQVGDLVTARVLIPGTSWLILTTVDRREFLQRLRPIALATVLVASIAGIILIVLVTYQVRTLLMPIKNLAEAAKAFAGGDLDVRVLTEGPREVSALADAFNTMAEKLERRTEDLVRSETRYRTAVQNSPNAVLSLDKGLHITLWNRQAEEIFGYSVEEAFGKKMDLLLEDSDYLELRRSIAQEREVKSIEAKGAAKNNKPLDLLISWAGQGGDNHNAFEWFVVIQDQTQSKRLQSQLIQSEKMSAIGNLIAGVAHELNNPLAAVTGFAELLKDIPAKKEEKEDLRHLHSSALRCRDIVQGLLSFARAESAVLTRVSLNKAVQEAITLFEYRIIKSDGMGLYVDLSRDDPEIAADFHKVQQVVVNLLGNACDALRDSPDPREIRARTKTVVDGVILEIEDSGPGVSEINRQRIFEPFFTTKAVSKGTGLGLSITSQIVTEFNGSIYCEAAQSGGAKFIVKFPLCPKDMPAAELDADMPPSTAGGRVLIVDDEPEVAQLIRRLLIEERMETVLAERPRDALKLIKEGDFDLVVTDIDMGTFKGTRLLEAAQGLASPPGFVFVTGDILNPVLMDELQGLDVPVIAKPFLRTEFLRAARRAIRKI